MAGPLDGVHMIDVGDVIAGPLAVMGKEAGIVVGYHGGDGAYMDMLSLWGEPRMLDFQDSTFNEVLAFNGKRNTPDTLTALICHGVFERFPRVRVATVENASDWVEPLLKELGRVAARCRRDSWKIPSRPSAAM